MFGRFPFFNSSFTSVLTAREAHAAHGPKLRLFGQFVGAWDVDITNYPAEGPARQVAGEWHFSWVLEGRAIEDVWIAPKRSLRGPLAEEVGEYGATLRFYDPRIDAWRSTWHGPVRGVVLPFIGREVGKEIVLEGSFEPGVAMRWIFSDITGRSFHWRAVESRDGWKTERMMQKMVAVRQPRWEPWASEFPVARGLPCRGLI